MSWSLVLAARRPEPLAEVAHQVRFGAGVLAVPTDVAQEAEVVALLARARERFGRVDALVNSAGCGRYASVDATPAGGLGSGPLRQSDRDVPLLQACPEADVGTGSRPDRERALHRQQGDLSGLGRLLRGEVGALGFTRVLAEEVRRKGIRVTAFCPGSVDTPFWDGLEWKPDAVRMMSPAAVADAIAFLLQQPPPLPTDEWVLMPRDGILLTRGAPN